MLTQLHRASASRTVINQVRRQTPSCVWKGRDTAKELYKTTGRETTARDWCEGVQTCKLKAINPKIRQAYHRIISRSGSDKKGRNASIQRIRVVSFPMHGVFKGVRKMTTSRPTEVSTSRLSPPFAVQPPPTGLLGITRWPPLSR